MNKLDFDPAYSAGVRNLLVQASVVRRRPRRRSWIVGLSIASLSVLGAGGAFASGYVLPGQDVVASLNQPRNVDGSGSRALDLGKAPAGTNSVEFTISCAGGSLSFPNGASQTCDGLQGTGSTSDMPWTVEDRTFAIRAGEETSWRLAYQFSHREATELGVNQDGKTYGTDGAGAHPDLIAVTATNGREGYIDAREESNASCAGMRSPNEALKCNRDHAQPTEIPVYLSDGETRIGVFTIG